MTTAEGTLFTPWQAPPADRARLSGQSVRILAALRLGPATNSQLSCLALKYTSRISDLRKAGYRITCTRVSGGTMIYRLEDPCPTT